MIMRAGPRRLKHNSVQGVLIFGCMRPMLTHPRKCLWAAWPSVTWTNHGLWPGATTSTMMATVLVVLRTYLGACSYGRRELHAHDPFHNLSNSYTRFAFLWEQLHSEHGTTIGTTGGKRLEILRVQSLRAPRTTTTTGNSFRRRTFIPPYWPEHIRVQEPVGSESRKRIGNLSSDKRRSPG